MANTFDGANMSFNNQGIMLLLAEVIKFRKQMTVREEKNSQSGWNDALNAFMMEGVENLNQTVKRITYFPDLISKDDEELRAADTSITQADIFNERALSADNVVMSAGPIRPVTWDLTGTGGDKDLPQLDEHNCPNDFMRAFITGLDSFFVQSTRLDSRWNAMTINKPESVQLLAALNALYTITQVKGGEVNRSDTPTGTMPSQEAATFNGPIVHEDVNLTNPGGNA